MKKLIFVNCILAIAVIFTYCAKPSLQEELSSVNAETPADNRAVCTLTNVGVSNDATLTLCGTNTNATGCPDCLNANVLGLELRTMAQMTLAGIALTTPIIVSVRANKLAVVNFTAGANSTGIIQIPVGGCRRFAIDANCNITAL